MARWRTQDYLCTCGWRDSVLVELQPDVQAGIDACPSAHPCPLCGELAVKVFSAPRIMTVALPDGTDRGDTWKRAKMAAKLRVERKALPPEKRADIDREIGNLNKENREKGKPDRFQP